jgi:hypothetical protein
MNRKRIKLRIGTNYDIQGILQGADMVVFFLISQIKMVWIY